MRIDLNQRRYKKCVISENKQCQNCKSNFRIEPADFAFYEKINVPPPTFCPECRLIRRLAWRNERTFYRRNCDLCKKPIISIWSPKSGLIVYCSPCWWSDKWDPMDYGVDFDPSSPFMQQVRNLFQKVPVMNLMGLYTTLVNSDYTHMVSYLKNCYLVTHSDNDENCAYGSMVDSSRDCVDNVLLDQCELCYEDVNCVKCFQTFFSVDCRECQNVYFSKNLSGCSNCFGSVNLRNKQYYVFNQPYGKEAYHAFVSERLRTLDGIEKSKKESIERWKKLPQKYMHGWHNVNVSGDYILRSKNTRDSFMVADVEDSRFIAFVTAVRNGKLTDSYDFSHYGAVSSRLYETMQAGDQVSDVYFSWWVITQAMRVEYSMFVINSSDIFGSVGLRQKQYCILNKQYTKEEHEKLAARIKEHMDTVPYVDKRGAMYKYGEFFPVELSPFGYNETTMQEFSLMTEAEAKAKGFSWQERLPYEYQVTLPSNKLPQEIINVSDSILQEVIGCSHEGKCNEQCTTAFRIIPQELEFYRKMNLPLPRLCPNCRHYQRIKQRNPLKLWHRTCQCAGRKSQAPNSNFQYENTAVHFHGQTPCPNEFETSYAPERPEIVYCEQCYQAEVI